MTEHMVKGANSSDLARSAGASKGLPATRGGRASAPGQPLKEANVWNSIHAGWRQLYGSFEHLGVSVESHDFRLERGFDWARSFHRNSLEVCLNLGGQGKVRSQSHELSFEGPTIGFYAAGENGLRASREAHKKPSALALKSSRVNPKHNNCRKTSQSQRRDSSSFPIIKMSAHKVQGDERQYSTDWNYRVPRGLCVKAPD